MKKNIKICTTILESLPDIKNSRLKRLHGLANPFKNLYKNIKNSRLKRLNGLANPFKNLYNNIKNSRL